MCGGDKVNPVSPAAKFPPSPSPPLLLQETFNVKEVATLSVCCSPTSSQIFAGPNHEFHSSKYLLVKNLNLVYEIMWR